MSQEDIRYSQSDIITRHLRAVCSGRSLDWQPQPVSSRRASQRPLRSSVASALVLVCLISRISHLPNLNPCPRKKTGGSASSRRPFADPNSLSGGFLYLGCLRSFGSLDYFKFDWITLLQCPVAVPGYRRVVYEHIRPILAANESVSFRIIEPLYCSVHFVSPLDGDSGGGDCKAPPRARIARSVSKWNHESRPQYYFLSALCIFIQI